MLFRSEFKASEPAPETLPDGRVRLPGDTVVQDAAVLLEDEWDTGASTVGGLITEALGHMPSEGETVVVGRWRFTVERVVDRAIASAMAARLVAASDDGAEQERR